jgi:multiple sugar transport system ATP-binding protein
VATFLGSPAMNILRGSLTAGDGVPGLMLDGALSLPLPGLSIDPRHSGQEVDIGLRPEHLLRCQPDDPHHFMAVLDAIEPVGSEAFAHLRYGPHALIARFTPEDLPVPGDLLPLRAAPGLSHVFDPLTGLRLPSGG